MIQLVNLLDLRSGPGQASPPEAEGFFEIEDLVEPDVQSQDSAVSSAREEEPAVPALSGSVMVLRFPLVAIAATAAGNTVTESVPSPAGPEPAGAVEDALPARPALGPAEGGRLDAFLPAPDVSLSANLHAPSPTASGQLDLLKPAQSPAGGIEAIRVGGNGSAGMPVLTPDPPREPLAEAPTQAAAAPLAAPALPHPGPGQVSVAPGSAPLAVANAQAPTGVQRTQVVPRGGPLDISTAAFAPDMVTPAPPTAATGLPEPVAGSQPLPPTTPVQMASVEVEPDGAASPPDPAVTAAMSGAEHRPVAARTETLPVSRQTTAEMRFHHMVLALGGRGAAGTAGAGPAPAVLTGPQALMRSAEGPPDPAPTGAIPFLSPMPAGPADVPAAGHGTAAPERAVPEGSGTAPADAAASADVVALAQPASGGPVRGEPIENVPNLSLQAIPPGPAPARAPDLGPSLAGPSTPEALTRQVAEHIVSHAGDMAEVQLSPVELGRLRFEITQRGEGVQIFILAERGETLDLLRRNGDQLLGDLRAMGFSGSELSFGAWGRQSEADKAPRAPDPERLSEMAVIAGSPTPSRPVAGTDGRGLDLRL